MKKIKLHAEGAYVVGLVLLALSVALMEKANLGISMVVAPAYILSLKFDFLTFGMAEYLLQAVLLVIMCLALREFRVSYLFSFVTAFVYGLILDGFISLCAGLPVNTLALRLLWFVLGMLGCAAGISLLFHTYFAPEVYELVVKEVSRKYNIPLSKCKTAYDFISCAVAILLSFALLGALKGVYWGTVFCALVNGTIIGWMGKGMEKIFDFSPKWKLEKYFI